MFTQEGREVTGLAPVLRIQAPIFSGNTDSPFHGAEVPTHFTTKKPP